MKFATRCIHSVGATDATGTITAPIYLTSTFAHLGLGQSTGYDYTRVSNPTTDKLENVIASLEHGTDALCFACGMAAVDAVMNLFKPGDHIICGDDLYGGAIRLFRSINEKNGMQFTSLHTSDLAAVKAAIKPNTRAIYVETPTNPLMEISDLKALAEIAHANGALLIVDNTFMTPYYQKPIQLGADIVVHSGTKYLGGHNDALAGFVVTNNTELGERLRIIYKTIGGIIGVFEAWLLIRSIKTLPIRMQKHNENAIKIAKWLQTQSKVTKVLYPGLSEHPGYELQKQQAQGFGGIISFYVDSAETAKALLEGVKLIKFAESLGGTESLITYPITQTHVDVPAEENERKGINYKLLRFSAGIEDVEDIIADLEQAFANVGA